MHTNRWIDANKFKHGLEDRYDDDSTAYTKQPCQYAANDSRGKHGDAEDEPLFHDQAFSLVAWKLRCSSMNVEMK